MGDEQRQELARLFTESDEFKAAILRATSVEDAVRIAGEYGIPATAEDFDKPDWAELSDAELEGVGGGYYTIPETSWGCATQAGCTRFVICW